MCRATAPAFEAPRVGEAHERRRPAVYAAVVDEPQPAVTLALEQVVDLARVDEPAEEMRHLAAAVPGVVVLQAAGVGVEQHPRGA